ncbi:MAG: Rieske (2Fe-2S) protein [Polyangiaceae bacterium]
MTKQESEEATEKATDPSPPEARPEEPSRRRALTTFVSAGSAVYAAALLLPAYRFIDQPRSAIVQGAQFFRIARLEALPEGKPVAFKVRGDHQDAYTLTRNQTLGAVWLQRQGQTVRAMTAECPHLGCAISLGPENTGFRCPCHTSRFSLEGQSESGPSPRSMDTLDTRIKDGWIEVAFSRFRQGVVTKEKIG